MFECFLLLLRHNVKYVINEKVMKQDLGLLFSEIEKLIGKKNPLGLKKIWQHFSTHKKLSPETLDKIALFAGFQSWKDLNEALHGEDDGQTNYEAEK